MEVADWLTVGDYAQNYQLNYISELVQWMGLQVVRDLGWLQNKRSLHGDTKTHNLLVFTSSHETVITICDFDSSLHLHAFGVDSSAYIQHCITSYN